MTNLEFSNQSQFFKDACAFAGTPATQRQASKFRMGKGKAFTKAKDRTGLMDFINQRKMEKMEEAYDE